MVGRVEQVYMRRRDVVDSSWCALYDLGGEEEEEAGKLSAEHCPSPHSHFKIKRFSLFAT